MNPFLVEGKARVKFLPFVIGSYSNGVAELTVQLPEGKRALAVGLAVDTEAALYDHQVTSFKHDEYEAIGSALQNGGTRRYVPLGHVGCSPGVDDSPAGAEWGFKLWPGPVKVGGMEGCCGVAPWPIKGGLPVTLTVSRLYGSTAITAASLMVLELDDDAEMQRICDGREKYTGRPLWQACGYLFNSGGAYIPSEVHDVLVKRYDGYALRIMQFFQLCYSNTGGTLAFDKAYAKSCGVAVDGYGRNPLGPEWMHKPAPVQTMAASLLPAFCGQRDPGMRVPSGSGVTLRPQKLVTSAQTAEMFLTAYGVLERE